MFVPALLLALAAIGGHSEERKGLYVHVEVTPTEARLGDVLFARISLQNRGGAAVSAPEGCSQEAGELRLQLQDPEEYTRYTFLPDGGPTGLRGKEILLEPGQTRVVSYSVIRLPRLDRINFRFWNPKSWRVGEYWLFAYCAGVSGRSARAIVIDRRPENEMTALLEYYDGEYKAPVPSGWDSWRPTLGVFGLLSFPLVCSMPEQLAVMEEKLSAGTLQHIVQATRLAAAVYDAKTVKEKRKITSRLLRWLDERSEIQRHCMASDLCGWAMGNKGLGEYSFEFIDQLIPRCPEASQEPLRKQNDVARRRYHGEVVPD
jgi:hypothetical protein